MPPATFRLSASSTQCASTSRFLSRYNSHDETAGFEELALRTLQALNPNRQLQASDICISRVRKLIGQFLKNKLPRSAKQVTTKTINTREQPRNSSQSPVVSVVGENKRAKKRSPASGHKSAQVPSSTSTKRQAGQRSSQNLPMIEEEPADAGRKTSNRSQLTSSSISRRISFGADSADSQDGEEFAEKPPPSQLELLLDDLVSSQTTASESFRLLLLELHTLFKVDRSVSVSSRKLLNFLDTQLLRNEIDSRRAPQKNIQCVEVQVLLELYKLKLRCDLNSSAIVDLETQSKALPKLRFLSIIAGAKHVTRFMKKTMDTDDLHNVVVLNHIHCLNTRFALSLPEQLKQLHDRMCIEMADEFKYLSQPSSTDHIFALKRCNQTEQQLSIDTPSTLASTPRDRSNSTPQSSSSAISGFHENDEEIEAERRASFPTLEKMPSLGSPPVSPTAKAHLDELGKNLFKSARSRKTSSSTNGSGNGSKVSTRRTTLNTDDDLPPKLSSPEVCVSDIDESTNDTALESAESEPLKFAIGKRSSRSTTLAVKRKIKEELDEEESSRESLPRRAFAASKTSKATARVDARGSIASRRQTNKRLCVIRQNVKDLILPTSRRSSTASLLQKTQQQQSTPRRLSYFERLAQEIQRPADSDKVLTKKVRTTIEEDKKFEPSTPSTSKKSKVPVSIITSAVLQRYRSRMNDLFKQSKQLDEHEVFYGRCNMRVDLFEQEKNAVEELPPKPSTSKAKSKQSRKPAEQQKRKQKNRSGHLVTQHNTDCLYIAHTLLNVHNTKPLSSFRPKPGHGQLIWGVDGRRAAAESEQPFRIRRLVRHANRAKVLKLRQYIQRSQQQQLLKKIKMEEGQVVKAAETPIATN